jgi:molybdate transport system regulatory protein
LCALAGCGNLLCVVPRPRSTRNAEGQIVVRSRAWLERNGLSLLGKGRLRLLEQIAERGSISGAARAIGVSYRLAWKWLAEMNAAAGRSLVETATGGKGGGGARLTPLGTALLEAVRLLNARLVEFDERMTLELERFFERPRGSDRARARPQR